MHRILKIILIGIGIFASVYFYKCYKDYYKEYDLVKSELNKITGIKIISLDGYSEDFELDNIFATIEVKDGTVLKFSGLNVKDFKASEKIFIEQINDWKFHRTNYRKDAISGGLNVGSSSEYLSLNTLRIKNIGDLVNNIDEIKKVVNKIPSYPKADTIKTEYQIVYIQKYNSNYPPKF